MKVGNIVKWSWCLGGGWEQTYFQGLVVNTIGTDYKKMRVLVVLVDDGSILDVRDDEVGLELVA